MPKMLRSRKKQEGQPDLSKYAQKKAAVACGTRDPFEFQATPCKESRASPMQPKPSNQVSIAPGETKIVWTLVTRIEIDRRFMFLKTAIGNLHVFITLYTLRKDHPETYLKIGSRLRCEVKLQTGRKSLVAIEVLEVRNAALNKEDAHLKTPK